VGELNSPPGTLPLDPAWGSRPPFRLAMRALATVPFLGKSWIGQCIWDLAVKSTVPEAEHIAITILQRCVNQKPRKFFPTLEFPGGGCPLVSFPTPLVISIAIVSSIAILLLNTYRGRNFRYCPALAYTALGNLLIKTYNYY